MAFNGIAFGLPLAMNSAEGTEAAMFVAAAATRSSWRRAMIALGAAVVTVVPVAGLIWLAFHFVGATYLDYAIAVVVLLLGARAISEGLSERPAGAGDTHPGAREPIGLAPASGASIRQFQRRHHLAETGVIDRRTQAAVRAARGEAGQRALDAYRYGVDVADADRVAEFQRRHQLDPTGVVDPATRGALRVAQQQGLVDALDPRCVARFQRDHGLDPTGVVDDATAVAIAAVRGEGATTLDGGDGAARVDPVTALALLDTGDAASIERFQTSLGLVADGVIGDETRGAIVALRSRLHPDPARPEYIHRFQAAHGLTGTGILDAPTRRAAADRLAASTRPRRSGLVPDPADDEAIRRLQRLYGLEPDGAIGPATQAAIRHARDFYCDVDPVDPGSIEAFQAEHGLTADGVIGPRTQTALTAVRAERLATGRKAAKRRYGDLAADGTHLLVDAADPDSVCQFQQSHGLEADGVVADRTRRALAVALAERRDGGPLIGDHNPDRGQGGGPIDSFRRLLGDAWPAYVGVVLETSEAILYSFAVASSTTALVPAVVGAGVGFSWPWALLPAVRKATKRVPEWKQEFVIGLVLVGVSITFGILHAAGVFR